jgi:hypothetical protein
MKTSLLMMSFLVLTSVSCKKEEFYEKEYLKPNDGKNEIPSTFITPPDENEMSSSDEATSASSEASSSSESSAESTSSSSSSSTSSSESTSSTGSNGMSSDSTSSTTGSESSSTTGASGSDSDSSTSSTGGSGSTSSTSSSESTSASSSGSESSSTTGASGSDSSTSSSSDSSTSSSSDSSSTTGSSGNPIFQTDMYIQSSEKAPVDVLWIVDNSGSMAEEQSSLATNFNYFISDFVKNDVDFNMGITTTDPRTFHAGVMKNPKLSLSDEAFKNNSHQFFNDFENYIQVGINGSGNEQGLNALEKFLNKNTDFLRNDSYLSVIIITDEEDQSSKQVSEYINIASSYKTSEKIKVYLIVDTNPKPSTIYGIETGHVRYQEFLNGFNGRKDDINGNFAVSLSDIGTSIASLANSFSLTQKPVAGTITVKVNGVSSTDYLYDQIINSIQFKDGFVPQDGAKVEINYEIQ